MSKFKGFVPNGHYFTVNCRGAGSGLFKKVFQDIMLGRVDKDLLQSSKLINLYDADQSEHLVCTRIKGHFKPNYCCTKIANAVCCKKILL